MESRPLAARDLATCGAMAALLVAAVAVLFHGTWLFTGEQTFFTHDIGASDLWHLHIPLKAFYAEALGAGQLPMWSPLIGGGFPVFAEGQVGALYLPNLILFSLLPLFVALNLSVLVTHVLGGAFSAMLARHLGASLSGAMVAAVVFAYCGFNLTHLKHLNMVAVAAWAPFLLLLTARAASGLRWGHVALIAACVASMIFAGHPQIAFNTLLVGGVWALAWLVFHAKAGWLVLLARGAGMVLGVGLGLVASAPQWMATLELSRLSLRQGGLSLETATAFAYSVSHLVAFVAPFAFGDPGQLRPEPLINNLGEQVVHPATGIPLDRWVGFVDPSANPTLFWEMTAYVGLGTLALAAVAVVLAWRRPMVRSVMALSVGSLALALGKAGGLFWLGWYLIPFFDRFRFHGRFLLYCDLALALLAALGLTLVVERLKAAGGVSARRLLGPAVIVLVVLDLFVALGDHNPAIASERWSSPPDTVTAMVAASGPEARFVANNPDFSVFTDAWMEAKGWKGDLSPYDSAKLALDPNLNLLYGISSATIYQQLYPLWMGHGADLLWKRYPEGPPTVDAKVAALFGVGWVVDASGRAHPGWEETIAFEGPPRHPQGVHFDPPIDQVPPHRIRLLKNKASVSTVRVVGGATVVTEDGAEPGKRPPSATLVRQPSFNGSEQVVLSVGGKEVAPPSSQPRAIPSAKVELTRPDPQSLILRVDSPEAGWLVVAETYYPGWEASVNGQPANVYRANVWMRAVAVPSGSSTVSMAFRP